ncbi:unnamed protein product [Cuscuta epithymum]|uniref:Uncharacterized protein n=1 Tax=Cuscuta epithymum TaxID=186058 RepID=A0AAV0FBE6_9ASTE|nr:unnamed protein product [Cuscuta epithymum]
MEFDFVKPIWGVYGFHFFLITHPTISLSICMATLKSQPMLIFLAAFLLISSSILPQSSLSSAHPHTNAAMRSTPTPPSISSTTELHPSRKRLPRSLRNPSSTQKPPDYGASYHEVPGGHNPASNRR